MQEPKLDRVPPQDKDAEAAIIGAMLLPEENKESIPKALSLIKAEDFYSGGNNKIFSAIQNLFDQGIKVDYVSVAHELDIMGEIEKIGGVKYLNDLSDSVPTATNVEYYCQIVKELSIRRKLIGLSSQIYHKAFDNTLEYKDLMHDAETSILRLRMGEKNGSIKNMKSVLKGTFQHIQDLYDKKESLLGQATGFYDLDNMTSGLQDGEYTIIGGRPGMGKSILAQNIIQYVAFEYKTPCLLFSAEMSSESVTTRILSAESGIVMQRLRTGTIKENEWAKLTIAASKIAEGKIFIDDVPGSIVDIVAKSHRMIGEHDIRLIVVDYLQLIKTERQQERRHEVEEVSGSLQRLAHELKIPVIALSQLNRSVEARPDKRPVLSDLRETGNIEQDADVVMFLYRDDYYNDREGGSGLNNGCAELIVRKQRNGPTGTVELVFDGAKMRFLNMAKRERQGELL